MPVKAIRAQVCWPIYVIKYGRVVAIAFVDDYAYEDVVRFSWHLDSNGYVIRYTGSCGTELLHRRVMHVTDSNIEIDHKNRNKLDNRRSNLREATRAQNAQNVGGWKNSSSKFRGVSFVKTTGRWRAYCRVNYKNFHIGTFNTEIKAAQAAAKFRQEHMPYATN